jgi:signal transduction histidine kinase/ActR/RegA family two-component response regulator
MRIPEPRGKLVRKYVVVLLLLVGGVLVVSSATQLYFSYQEATAALARVASEKAVAAAARIEQFVKEIEHQLRRTTQPAFEDVAAVLEQREIDYLRLLRNVLAISELRHLDAAGKEQLRVSRFGLDAIGSQTDLSHETAFLEARVGRTYYGPVYFRDGSEPYLTIAVPAGELHTEVTMAQVNLKAIWHAVSRIRVGRTGYVYVVNSGGQLIAHPDISLVLQRRDLSALPQLRAARAGSGEARDERAVFVGDGLGGGSVLSAYAPIASLGWLVITEQPLEEAFTPLRAAIVRSILLFAAGLVLAVLASLLLARRMVAPIQILQAGASRIGAGELGHRIRVETGDELEALGEEFNRTATQLQASYGTLEQKVEERTQELAAMVENLRALSEVSQTVTATLDLETVLATIVSHAVELSGSFSGTIYEFDEAAQNFHARATHRISEEHLEALRAAPVRLGEGAVGSAVLSRQPVQVTDIEAERHRIAPQVQEIVTREGLRSLLAIPLFREARVFGGLVIWRKERGAFAKEVVGTLQTFAAQSALAIQNARLFREIEEQGRQLEQASRHKSQFLASMSHELRTPLNAVIGFSRLLQSDRREPPTARQKDRLAEILKGGQHLLELINEVLDLATIEAGKVAISPEDVSLKEVFEECLTLTEILAAERGVKIIVSPVDVEMPVVRADHTRCNQALLNILSNAVKYNCERGEVVLSCGSAPNGMIRVSVSDTGKGIAEDKQQELFEPFSRLGAEATETEGTGIGLSITKRLVELMDGEIGFESTEGEGSTFWIDLPQAKELIVSEEAMSVTKRAQAGQGESPAGVLLYVEDDPANLKLLAEVIDDRLPNLTMLSALNGEQGLELAREHEPDVIVLDINLPGMDGFTALEHLMRSEITHHIPVIALSVKAMPSSIKKGLEAGFRLYLTKPIDPDEVQSAVEEVLGELG